MTVVCKAWGVNYLRPCVPSGEHRAPCGTPRCIYCTGYVAPRDKEQQR